MTDDRIAKDSARSPEREALGSVRGGLRAAAKKAARKVAKKTVRKKAASKASAASKTSSGAGKTTGRGAASSKKADRTARTAAPASGAPAPGASAEPTRPAAAGEAAAHAPKAAAADPAAASGRAATASAAPAAPSRDSGPTIDTPRPPGPMHPGAAMDPMQEQSGGLGGLLALWGPLIIVGFLVLVFRGGAEPETAVATAPDASDRETTVVADTVARVSSRYARGAAETFDGGFTMRTSMAGPPALSGRGAGAAGPPIAPGAAYPSPPGPYRDPRYRSLPTGERWSADGPVEWMWSAEGRTGPPPADGGDAPVRWVRCEAPYYWCPAPGRPVW